MSITHGYVEEAEIGAGRFTVHREPNPSRVPVVVVTVEEWAEIVNALREFLEMDRGTPPERILAAILGTNGGEDNG